MKLQDEVNEFLLDLLVGLVAIYTLAVAEQAERVCRLAIHLVGARRVLFVEEDVGREGRGSGRRASRVAPAI